MAQKPKESGVSTIMSRDEQRMIKAKDVAHLYGCGVSSVYELAKRGDIPRGVKIGRMRRWNLAEINAHIARGCAPLGGTHLSIRQPRRRKVPDRDTRAEIDSDEDADEF
jgi:predicted DNA-binding transcriptional regulator AlpA